MGKMELQKSSDVQRRDAPAMYLRAMCYVTLALLPFGAASVAAEAPTPIALQIKELEEAILSHRRAITAGHFRVKQIYDSYWRGRHSEAEITTYYDGLLVREDAKVRDRVTTQCFGEQYYYSYCTGKPTAPGKYALGMKDLSHASRKDEYLHEPLKLMFYCSTYTGAANYTLDTLIGSPQRKDLVIEPATWEGQKAWKVSFTYTPVEAVVTYWAVPSWGYSIVRMFVPWKSENGSANEDSIQCSVQQTRNGIWFPKTVRYRRLTNGTAALSEDLEIEVMSVNEPIDRRMFGPETMNVPPDTVVTMMPAVLGTDMKWDGKKLVVMSEDEKIRLMFPGPKKSDAGRRIGLLVVSGILAAIGGAVMWWRYMRKPSDAR